MSESKQPYLIPTTQKIPFDVDNLATCIRKRPRGSIEVYCVECDAWCGVSVEFPAVVSYSTLDRANYRLESIDTYTPTFVCLRCSCDVGYIVVGGWRDKVLRAVGVK